MKEKLFVTFLAIILAVALAGLTGCKDKGKSTTTETDGGSAWTDYESPLFGGADDEDVGEEICVPAHKIAYKDGERDIDLVHPTPLNFALVHRACEARDENQAEQAELAFVLQEKGGSIVGTEFEWSDEYKTMTVRPKKISDLKEGVEYKVKFDDTWYEFRTAVNGDVNGDGVQDLLMGGKGRNRAYLVMGGNHIRGFGSDKSINLIDEKVVLEGSGGFGQAVLLADVNVDGYADAVVGAPNYGKGSLHVFLGGSDQVGESNKMIIEGESSGSGFGSAVKAYDMDGDGVKDLIIGAPGVKNASNKVVGGVYIILSRGADVASAGDANKLITGEHDIWPFGYAFDVGDLNDDELMDLVIGAHGGNNIGKAYVFLDALNENTSSASMRITGEHQSPQQARFGAVISAAGDVNGDGYDDVLIAAPDTTLTQPHAPNDYVCRGAGRVYVLYGRNSLSGNIDIADAVTANEALMVDAGISNCVPPFELTNWYLGAALSPLGDIDGDGKDDFVVGIPGYDGSPGQQDGGAVRVVTGGGTSSTDLEEIPGMQNTDFGRSIGSKLDVDGDGLDDIIVGAPSYWASGGKQHGQVTIFFGDENAPFSTRVSIIGVIESTEGDKLNLSTHDIW